MAGAFIAVLTPLLMHTTIYTITGILCKYVADTTTATAIAALLVIPAAVWMGCGKEEKLENLTLKTVVPGILCFFAGIILNLILSWCMNALHLNELFSNQTQEELLAGEWMIQIIGLVLLIPVSEELVFRGLIYQRMKKILPVSFAIVFSALLFSVYHGNPIQMIFAFPMALVLALVYEKGGTLIFPILFHLGSNFAAVLLNALG